MLKEDIVIVSGGDAKYFHLLLELAQSLSSQPESNDYKLAFLDGGLENQQCSDLKALGASIVVPGWCHPLAKKKCKGRDYLKINIAKLHLDQLFPEAKIIIWVDGDTWFQNLIAIKLFVTVAKKGKLAIVSQASRLQESHIAYRQKLFGLVELRNILYKNARKAALPKHLINNLMAKPTLNAGAYALMQNAPHWERFRYWQDIILKRGRLFTSDQLAFGLTVFSDGFPYEALPDICNYRGPWRWDEEKRIFVDYYAPYDEVSIMHLCGQDEIRDNPEYCTSMLNQKDEEIS
ncbi:MAG: glycosyl transferase, partial [Gammaproteobacteria bacterium]